LLLLPASGDNAAMQTEPPKTDPPKYNRRWFQFSLRTLLIPLALGVVAVVYFFVLPAIHDLQKRQETQKKLQQIGDAVDRYEAQQRLPKTAQHSFDPEDGYVPDADTAIKIAVAVWEPIYGKDQIAGEKPYQAHHANGVWTVEGSLPDGWDGGVAIAEIAKKDGKILRVSHGK
jgi:hypothetical protein